LHQCPENFQPVAMRERTERGNGSSRVHAADYTTLIVYFNFY
jgi:hypothetical protein